jgi:hypothetical protein
VGFILTPLADERLAVLPLLREPGLPYRNLREAGPSTEIALAWRARDARPALHRFVELVRSMVKPAAARRS